MRPRLWVLFGFGAAVFLGLGWVWLGQGTQRPNEAVRVGTAAPDFRLADLDGQSRQLSAWRGRPVLVNFWGTWCGPCALEIPIFQHYARLYPDLVVVGVNVGESADVVQEYAQRWGLTFPILLDAEQEVMRRYAVTGLPTSFFLDANGVIQAIQVGGLNDAQIVANLEKIGISMLPTPAEREQ